MYEHGKSWAVVGWAAAGFTIGAIGIVLLDRGPSHVGDMGVSGRDNSFGKGMSMLDEPDVSAYVQHSSDTAASDVGVFTGQLSAYSHAVSIDDPAGLAARIQALVRMPLTTVNVVEMEALFGRWFQIDPSAAVDVLVSSRFPLPVLTSICELWAELDSEAAIAILDEVYDPATERVLALAIIKIAGIESVDTVVAGSRTLDAHALEMAHLVQLANADPLSALRQVNRLSSFQAQQLVLEEIGLIAASRDTDAAIAAAESIVNSRLKEAYVKALYDRWSLVDTPTFIEHLETLDPSEEEVTRLLWDALAHASGADADALLEAGRRIGGPLGLAAEASALNSLAMFEPNAALSQIAGVPIGHRRDALIPAVASGYAHHDLESALSWSTTLVPPNSQAVQAVLTVMASSDLQRAVRFELQDPTTTIGAVVGTSAVPPWFSDGMLSDLDGAVQIASQIVASSEDGRWKEAMLETVLSRWVSTDPDTAIAWIQSQPGEISLNALGLVAEQAIGANDVEGLLRFADTLPSERRSEWIAMTVGNTALIDPNRAMDIAERYRVEPYYQSLVEKIVRTVARSAGPERAAKVLGETPSQASVLRISKLWVDLEPEKAMTWASELQDVGARTTAVTSVLLSWIERDPDAAMEQVGLLADPSLREVILTQLCERVPEDKGCVY